MIIMKIKGGLGNQLFQYAFGRALAIKFGKKLKFDLSFYRQQDLRSFALNRFNITFDGILNFKEKFELKLRSYLPALSGEIYYFRENKGLLNFQGLTESKICIIDGYWQSEKYFVEMSDVVKKELCLKNLSVVDAVITQNIISTNSVSLHVRRGDYVSVPVNKPYNICDLNYYQRAMQIIKNQVTDPVVFIFSDDLDWVKDNLKLDVPHFFVHGNDECVDFYMMSLCKHNIMANSTFSWWAAWLNNNPKKIVVAPKMWLKNEIREELFTDYQIRI